MRNHIDTHQSRLLGFFRVAIAALCAAIVSMAMITAPRVVLALGLPVNSGRFENPSCSQGSDGPTGSTEISANRLSSVTVSAAMSSAQAKSKKATICYRVYVQDDGWLKWKKNGKTAGTTGEGQRVEGIEIKLKNTPYSGGVQYRAHVQRIGWQGWRKDGELAGTTDRGLRVEAVQIRLTGDMASHYDVYYRVHVQNYGWLDWAKNGQSSGTMGCGYRVEAIEIKLVKTGGSAPGSTAHPFEIDPMPEQDQDASNAESASGGSDDYVPETGGSNAESPSASESNNSGSGDGAHVTADEVIVYVARNGKGEVFHTEEHCHNMTTGRAMTLAEARANNKRPCDDCAFWCWRIQ